MRFVSSLVLALMLVGSRAFANATQVIPAPDADVAKLLSLVNSNKDTVGCLKKIDLKIDRAGKPKQVKLASTASQQRTKCLEQKIKRMTFLPRTGCAKSKKIHFVFKT